MTTGGASVRGDVEELRSRARLLERCAADLDDEAQRLARRDAVGWTSSDAQQWRQELADLRRDVRAQADQLREAAGRLRRHAEEVEQTLARIAAAESWFTGRLADARRTLAAGADAVGDAAVSSARAVVSAARSAPRPGSLDWLGFGG